MFQSESRSSSLELSKGYGEVPSSSHPLHTRRHQVDGFGALVRRYNRCRVLGYDHSDNMFLLLWSANLCSMWKNTVMKHLSHTWRFMGSYKWVYKYFITILLRGSITHLLVPMNLQAVTPCKASNLEQGPDSCGAEPHSVKTRIQPITVTDSMTTDDPPSREEPLNPKPLNP